LNIYGAILLKVLQLNNVKDGFDSGSCCWR
jgi:hypothetical protein